MAVFSVNQATHLYYMGQISPDGGESFAAKDYIYFVSDNGLRSDLIDKKNILSIATTTTAEMAISTTNVELTLDGVAIDANTKVIPGEYVVRFVINNYYGPSMYDGAITHAAVFVGANTTQADFMKALEDSINKNLSRELEKPFTAVASGNKLTITPIATEWKLGTKAVTVPSIDVLGVWKDFGNGFEQEWLIATKVAGAAVAGSGTQKLCDLEYFCLGERGDIYRNVGWPNVVETKGVLTPGEEYDVVTIHYAYVGSNEAVQKSEKTVVLVLDEGESQNFKDWLSSAGVTEPASESTESGE